MEHIDRKHIKSVCLFSSWKVAVWHLPTADTAFKLQVSESDVGNLSHTTKTMDGVVMVIA